MAADDDRPVVASRQADPLRRLHFWGASDFNPAQLLTYMFMHSTGSFAHILFNMFTLFMFGITLERVLGSQRYLFYYISCGIGAAVVQEIVWQLTWVDILAGWINSSYGSGINEAKDIIMQAHAMGQKYPRTQQPPLP